MWLNYTLFQNSQGYFGIAEKSAAFLSFLGTTIKLDQSQDLFSIGLAAWV
jgi:hypothetical protein